MEKVHDDDNLMPPVGTYAFTARLMADLMPDDEDPDFWDRWKDEMKDRDLDD